jgi:hypothetical protein
MVSAIVLGRGVGLPVTPYIGFARASHALPVQSPSRGEESGSSSGILTSGDRSVEHTQTAAYHPNLDIHDDREPQTPEEFEAGDDGE